MDRLEAKALEEEEVDVLKEEEEREEKGLEDIMGEIAGEFSEAENPALTTYREEYNKLPEEVKNRCTWEEISERLLANDAEKLNLVKAMQGGGELFGIDIDAEGKALFKDKGVEPVMYGFDAKNKLIQIYDRNSKQMSRVVEWADYHKILERVLKDGYEMFPGDGNDRYGNDGYGNEMRQVETHTGNPFVASEDRKEWRLTWLKESRLTWLKSGEIGPIRAQAALFGPGFGLVSVYWEKPSRGDKLCGVVRLLKV